MFTLTVKRGPILLGQGEGKWHPSWRNAMLQAVDGNILETPGCIRAMKQNIRDLHGTHEPFCTLKGETYLHMTWCGRGACRRRRSTSLAHLYCRSTFIGVTAKLSEDQYLMWGGGSFSIKVPNGQKRRRELPGPWSRRIRCIDILKYTPITNSKIAVSA